MVPVAARKTGHRIKYAKVDADTGEEVPVIAHGGRAGAEKAASDVKQQNEFAPAARCAPESCQKISPFKQRARGMPGAQCTRSLVRAGGQ